MAVGRRVRQNRASPRGRPRAIRRRPNTTEIERAEAVTMLKMGATVKHVAETFQRNQRLGFSAALTVFLRVLRLFVRRNVMLKLSR